MSTLAPALAVIQGSEGGSLLRTMIDAIPTDPAALFILALLVGATGVVIYYGTRSGEKEDEKKS
ncbi:MAG TPA: hypothetical protein VLH75_20000 [Longimicrobiales bacterium]|nr:hypothetical protein [Longimicrobiales bacterium]